MRIHPYHQADWKHILQPSACSIWHYSLLLPFTFLPYTRDFLTFVYFPPPPSYSLAMKSSSSIAPAVFSIGCLHIILQLKYSTLGCCVIFIPSQMNACLVSHGGKEQHFLISTFLTITEVMENERGPEPQCIPLCEMVQINSIYITLHLGYCCSNVAFLSVNIAYFLESIKTFSQTTESTG